jgi:calcineurin-like phosphoesterase family protein
MIWFTADPHLGHENIVKYCRRPFWTTAGDIRERFAENRVPDHVKDEERWPDIEKHDETLIENWNSRVAVDDEVWIIGDFCWWHLDEVMVRAYYARLNGYKHLVLGNHDTDGDDEPLPVLVDLFGDRLHRYKQLRIGSDGRRKPLSRKGGQRVILFHYAMRGWENDYHNPAKGKTGSWHFYGHYHGRLMSHRTSFDVGVDVCNYAPISWPEVEQKMRAILNEKDPI